MNITNLSSIAKIIKKGVNAEYYYQKEGPIFVIIVDYGIPFQYKKPVYNLKIFNKGSSEYEVIYSKGWATYQNKIVNTKEELIKLIVKKLKNK